ncbi:hypothetical protein ACIPIU_11655 [Streptomyces massasporeus]|uniref:hypothetical protein n=1 Tax=Streptomyces massasporeus TaxID=67324 RepID=UPI00382A63F2
MHLAAQMPPAILSQVLGISARAATGRAASGSPRSQYVSELSRRPKSGYRN